MRLYTLTYNLTTHSKKIKRGNPPLFYIFVLTQNNFGEMSIIYLIVLTQNNFGEMVY